MASSSGTARAVIRPMVPNHARTPAAVFMPGAWAAGATGGAEEPDAGDTGELAQHLLDEAESVREYAHKLAATLPKKDRFGKLQWTAEQKVHWADFSKPLPNPAITHDGSAPKRTRFRLSRRGAVVSAPLTQYFSNLSSSNLSSSTIHDSLTARAPAVLRRCTCSIRPRSGRGTAPSPGASGAAAPTASRPTDGRSSRRMAACCRCLSQAGSIGSMGACTSTTGARSLARLVRRAHRGTRSTPSS